MSNSPLISYTQLSPNKNSPRNHIIDTITIHCYVGQISVERGCSGFAKPERQASCNYIIGTDGRIALCVDEADRSWCSSNEDNDHRAITIECASDTKPPYAINDSVYNSLVNLCEDICRRNAIKELKWKGDRSLIGKVSEQNMTVHRWFAAKACPGDYIYERLGQIASDVNARLTPTKMIYRVRLEWTDSKSQKGAFTNLINAKKCADQNPGYKVFDGSGNMVYPKPSIDASTLENKITVETIQNGSKSEAVKSMQALLNSKISAGLQVDGIFETKSETAVRNFQKEKGITVDGICGPNTWKALIG